MNTLIKFAVVVGALSSLVYGEQACAQNVGRNINYSEFQNRGQSIRNRILGRPTVSPYLNLLNSTNSTGVPTYFTQVRPQIDARRAASQTQRQIRNVQQQYNALNSRMSSNAQGGVLTTGHPTRFMNYLQYYPQLSQ